MGHGQHLYLKWIWIWWLCCHRQIQLSWKQTPLGAYEKHPMVYIASRQQSENLWNLYYEYPDSKVHGVNMGPTWVLSAPDGPQVGPMNFVIRVLSGKHVSIIYPLYSHFPRTVMPWPACSKWSCSCRLRWTASAQLRNSYRETAPTNRRALRWETGTKWTPFNRQHFQMIFLKKIFRWISARKT